jgi:subtilisin-like proprotein convertase family protein
MPAINYNFDIEKGSDFEITFIYTDETGSPVDLSSRCVVFSIVPAEPSGSIIQYKNNDPDEAYRYSLTVNNLGFINLKTSAIETNSFNFASASYDLDVRGIDDSSNIRISTGFINIIQRNTPLNIIPRNTSDPLSFDRFASCENINSSVGSPVDTNNPDGTNPSPTPIPLPDAEIEDLCLPDTCSPLGLFARSYLGSSLILDDLSTVTGTINVSNTGIITNIDVKISNLNHSSPTDLIFILSPPSGNDILLAANHKIPKYTPNFNFTFSNLAESGKYLHTISNNDRCRIYDKTSIIKHDTPLSYSFDSLFGQSLPGQWNLIVQDTDPSGTGSIGSWFLEISYESSIQTTPNQPVIHNIYRFEDETVVEFYAPTDNGGSDIIQYLVYSDDNLIEPPSTIDSDNNLIIYKYTVDYSATDIEISAVNDFGEGPRSLPFTVPI